MTTPLSPPERATQRRVIELFRHELGYRYLGDWSERGARNQPVEDELLTASLAHRGYTPAQIARALDLLHREADHPTRPLYDSNKAVYGLLRYGVPVKTDAGQPTETVHLIDWQHPERNDFALAEEVTLRRQGHRERRPDLVLYVNGLAIGVLELKNSRVSLGDGIGQNLSNQQPDFNPWFFTTVQFVFAGNDSQGLRYGTIGTPAQHFLAWKEDEQDDSRFKLDKYLLKLCAKPRLTELMHDFVLFDGGVKKLPRVHQYFGLKAAQQHVRDRRSGILWHTQGAGKSILMVLLAKWILENRPQARVVVVTDRDELDKQIERVFRDAGETIQRSRSGRDLLAQLAQPAPRLLCALVHKFGRRDVNDIDAFLKDMAARPSPTLGEVFVFVDECHRTQGGRLNRFMKAAMPQAVFIGFTGTPLLKEDQQTSHEVFGSYIHTYKFTEAVQDGVVLDLVYEARDIDQQLGSPERVDGWFEAKTRALNDWQKHALKERWGTMQSVLSSRSRMEKVVCDIEYDFSVKPRLSTQRGNAILVAASIYEACKYFVLLQKTPLRGHCAIVTSYNPQAQDVTREETGTNSETDRQFVFNTYTELLKNTQPRPGLTRTEAYEEAVKQQFIKEPARMKLLVVVDKLLTGFDAPPCSVLYIDKSMQDHGLFQAICRTNRLDGDDKDFGYIVDYKDLFKKVEKSIAVYTSEIAHDPAAGRADPEVLLQTRLKACREKLDQAVETLALLCESVEPPRDELAHIRYFCGNTEVASDVQERAPQRAALYKATAALVRAWANLADEMSAAGYSPEDTARIRAKVNAGVDLRQTIRNASGETIDLKAYEADMRHLIDTYIEASMPRRISPFDDLSLLALIVKTGIADAIAERLATLKGNQEAVAETIENNVRSKILQDHLNDPAYYEKMSALLDELIQTRKAKAVEYAAYLQQIAELAAKVETGHTDATSQRLDTPGKRALHNMLVKLRSSGPSSTAARTTAQEPAPTGWNTTTDDDSPEEVLLALAVKIDETVQRVRPDGWRGNRPKERVIQGALMTLLGNSHEVEQIFPILQSQPEYWG